MIAMVCGRGATEVRHRGRDNRNRLGLPLAHSSAFRRGATDTINRLPHWFVSAEQLSAVLPLHHFIVTGDVTDFEV